MIRTLSGFVLGLFCLALFGVVGPAAGQDRSRPGETPRVVSAPQPPVDPEREALAEQLKLCRAKGDSEGALKILKQLEPSLSFAPGSVSGKPLDITFGFGLPNDGQSDLKNWMSPDIPVFWSINVEAHPDLACTYYSRTNTPKLFAAAELWNGASTQDKIQVKASADHGQTWSAAICTLDDAYPLVRPRIVQVASGFLGILYERWYSSTDPDIVFTRTPLDLSYQESFAVDTSGSYTFSPRLTSDFEQYPSDPWIYVVYYKKTYVGGSTPYQFDLIFRRSTDAGATWSTERSLASFESVAEYVTCSCSIDYESSTLYIAYTDAAVTTLSVIKSTDLGSNWSVPVQVVGSWPNSYVDVAVADATHAMVVNTANYGAQNEVTYGYTVDGSTWNTFISVPHLGSNLDDEKHACISANGNRYYVAYGDFTLNSVVTTNVDYGDVSWTPALNVKNSAYGLEYPNASGMDIIAKPGPSGGAGSAVVWSEAFSASDADVYGDAVWEPFPILRTPVADIPFGSLMIGGVLNSTTTLHNDGNAGLTVNSITRTAGSAYFSYLTPATPFTIAAGGSQNVTVRFAPLAVGAASATFTVASTDPATPSTTFSATGTGLAAPDIHMPVTTCDFGNLSLGVSKDISLTIQNLGTADLHIYSFFGSGDTSDFAWNYTETISAGGTGYIKFRFTPTAAGSRSAVISIESNDPDEPGYPVTVSGTGLAFIPPLHNHAVGDFDGDGAAEVAMDFGASGVYMWNAGVWSQISANNAENMIAFKFDADSADELAVDFGGLGLWLWNGGAWSQLGINNPEYLIAADTNGNGIEELILDLGATGLWWRQENGTMFRMTSYDPQNIIALDVDHNGTQEVVADFDGTGLWLWQAAGTTWTMLSGYDAITIAAADSLGSGSQGVAASLTGVGLWLWQSGLWAQLGGIGSDHIFAGPMIAGGGQEVGGDFGPRGLWLWGSNVWTQLSGVDADDSIGADIDGDGVDEIIGDFGTLGLWVWDSGSWSQLSGVNPDNIQAGDVDGDNAQELIVDFGTLGVWLWNGGSWSQVSPLNPD